MQKIKKITSARLFWPLTALVLVILFNVIFIEGFLNLEIKDGHLYGRLIDIINRSGPLMLLSMGMTLVIATNGTDISVGSVGAISGAIAAVLIGGRVDGVPQNSLFVAILVALFASTLIGTWNGFLISKLNIQPIVATLILLVAGRGIAQLITAGQIITVYYKPFSYIGGYIPGVVLPTSLFITLIMVTILFLLIKKTALGLFIQSAGINPLASKYSGIDVSKIKLMVYGFSGLCAGIAGLIIASMIKAADSNNAGLFIEMDAILAVAIGGNSLNGGKFSVAASLIGAIIVQSLYTTMYAIGVSPEILPVVKATVVIIICLIQSEDFRRIVSGLFSRNGGGQHEKTTVKL